LTSEVTNVSASVHDDQVICTLFEGHYHIGFAVLLNSILRGGYSGLIYVGHRGELPPWTSQLKQLGPGLFETTNGARLAFELLTPDAHFTNHKPNFMLDLIQRGIATKYLWYFDPDITVRCSWKFLESWAAFGICLISDTTNGNMPPRHPLRCMWVEHALKAGWGEPTTEQTRYFNAGFVGLDVRYASFLERWRDGIAMAVKAGTDVTAFMIGSREDTFFIVDQDMLNLSTMYAREPISAMGPEAMGFVPGGFTMYHSVGIPKPWRKRFVRLALAAKPPSNGDKHFLLCAEGPIQPFTPSELNSMRRAAKVGSMIGRFYIRT